MDIDEVGDFFDLHDIRFSKSFDGGVISYRLVDETDEKVRLTILDHEMFRYSIYVNNHGNYISYEKYQSTAEFITDLEIVLKSQVHLKSIIEEDQVIRNIFSFTTPEDLSHNTFSVIEHVNKGSLFSYKEYRTISFLPWLK